MRIVSLAPFATEMVHALGLADDLVGRSHACDFPADVAGVPALTRPGTDGDGRRLDGAALERLEPDLVLTDGSDDPPVVDYAEVSAVVGGLQRDVTLVALAPQSVEGMLNAISTIGAYTESEYESIGLVEVLRERLASIEGGTGPTARRVVVLDSLDPPSAAGRWVPELVRRAGGWEVLGREGEPSTPTSWRQLREVEPQVLVLALRDADAEAAARALTSAPLPSWFDELEAVRDGSFYAVDGHGLFARPGPRMIDGIAVLAELFEPEIYAGAGPVGAWTPLAPVGLAGRRRAGRPGG